MQEWATVFLIGLVVFSTFTVEGIAGFGATVMALPFVIMLIGLDKAVPLLSTLGLVLSMFLISRSWRNLVGKEYFFIALHVGAGVPVGLLISDFLPKKILIAILVFFTFFVGIRGLMQLMRQNAESMRIKPAKKKFPMLLCVFQKLELSSMTKQQFQQVIPVVNLSVNM